MDSDDQSIRIFWFVSIANFITTVFSTLTTPTINRKSRKINNTGMHFHPVFRFYNAYYLLLSFCNLTAKTPFFLPEKREKHLLLVWNSACLTMKCIVISWFLSALSRCHRIALVSSCPDKAPKKITKQKIK